MEEDPDVAVQSFDTTLTYHKLDRICHYVRNGVPLSQRIWIPTAQRNTDLCQTVEQCAA